MANFQENRLALEKNFFLTQAKKNPIFLLQHFQSLLGVILQQGTARLLTKLRGRFRGNKMTPAWLRSLGMANRSHCVTLDELLQRTPLFVLKATDTTITELAWHSDIIDPENYFAQHRWGMLTDKLLAQIDADQLPATIAQQMTKTLNDPAAALETYSTCERIANLLTWLAFMPRAQRLAVMPANTLAFLEKSLQWVLSHLEFYGKRTGNHILNNARSLIMAGVVLNNKFAVTTGYLIFENMLPVLIQRDGFLRERSSHYQLIVLGWLLDAYAFVQGTEFYSPEQMEFLRAYISKMSSAAASLCDDQGNLLAMIGDISPDASPSKTTQRLRQCHTGFWPVAAAANGLRDDWCFLQSQQSRVILNCPAGVYPKSFSSHAHNDIPGFVWLYHNEPVLIDCGRARYTKDAISVLQKSAYGHNVPLVNGFAPLSESLVTNGNWWPTPYASAHVAIASDAAHRVTISHNGFQRATPVQEHQRQILLGDQELRVEDFFKGQGEIELELRWQLPPGFVLLEKNKKLSNGSITLEIDLTGMKNLPVMAYHSVDQPLSWSSSQYGIAEANPVITMRWQVLLPFTTSILFKVNSCVA
jgi:hypothetical protein